jgi:hypothetical protein
LIFTTQVHLWAGLPREVIESQRKALDLGSGGEGRCGVSVSVPSRLVV